MNPFIQAVIMSVLKRKRTCEKCGRDQIVPRSKMKDTVPCKFCGVDIPPTK